MGSWNSRPDTVMWLPVTILLLLVCVTARADDTTEQHLPSRLAPLGLERLMDMQVSTVTRTESTVGQSSAAVTVISPEDIRRSTTNLIPELLRRVPGMNVERIDNNKWAIGARGFSERFTGKLLVQMDGRTLYNPFTSGVYWDVVDYPLEEIERIEVIRGPRAGVWGANAVNGIINIITRNSKDSQGGLVTAGGGSQERGFGTARYGGKFDEGATYRIYAKGFYRDEQYARDTDAHDAWSGGSGGFRFDWQRGDDNLVTFQGDYLHSDADRHDFRAAPTPPYSFENYETESTDNGNVLLRWTHSNRADSKWSLQAYWDGFHRYQDSLKIRFRWDTYDLDLQHEFRLGTRHGFLWGAGYRVIDSHISNSGRDNGFVFNLTDNRHDKQTLSVYGQYELTVVEDRLKLYLNSRFENNDFTGFEWQPSAQILYTPTTSQTVWASVARALRTPNLNEYYAQPRLLPVSTDPPVFPRQFPNPDLESEEVISYQLGHRIQFAGSLSFDTALFYNSYDDLVTPRRGSERPGAVGSDAPVLLVNGLEGESYGAELSTTWHPARWWKLYGAYSHLQIHLRRGVGGLPPSAGAAEGQSPRNQLYLQSSFEMPRNTELDLVGRWVDSLTGFNPAGATGGTNRIPSYFALDARVAWRPTKDIEVSLVGQNLTDSHHPEFGTSPLVRSPLVEIRRAVYGKVTWRL